MDTIVIAVCCSNPWSPVWCLAVCCICSQPVEILWIHNQQWAGWERSLPDKTHELLQKHRKGQRGTGGVHHKSMVKRETLDGQLQQGVYNGVSHGRGPWVGVQPQAL